MAKKNLSDFNALIQDRQPDVPPGATRVMNPAGTVVQSPVGTYINGAGGDGRSYQWGMSGMGALAPGGNPMPLRAGEYDPFAPIPGSVKQRRR